MAGILAHEHVVVGPLMLKPAHACPVRVMSGVFGSKPIATGNCTREHRPDGVFPRLKKWLHVKLPTKVPVVSGSNAPVVYEYLGKAVYIFSLKDNLIVPQEIVRHLKFPA
jgi:hypothetical protein